MTPNFRSMRRLALGAALAASAACAGGCSRNAPAATENTAGRADDGAHQTERDTRAARAQGDLTAQECAVAAVYFAFDSSELDDRARSQLEANKRCIESRRVGQVRVTGMADPRGTEEYNLALGERRARQVASYMSRLGVNGSAIQVHSVGEEYASGTGEGGWSQDRRAELDAH